MQAAHAEIARRHMIDSQLRTSGVSAPWVLAAMGATPRERFVPADKAAVAYLDRSIAIGGDRKLNPPVATGQMLQAAEIGDDDNVLIIGAGSGYLAALLGNKPRSLVAVESDPALAATARVNVPGLQLVEAPLAEGAPGHAPYSLILIDGAIELLPPAIEAQLADGGRIVTGLTEGAVSRLAIGRKHGAHVALRPFADMEVAPLPGFERAREFVF